MSNSLDFEQQTSPLKSLAIYGMGGVGKTKIALQFVQNNKDKYDAIFWIASDNAISMGQSFREIVEILGLVSEEDDMKDTAVAIQKVKTWLAETQCHWLLVFDNVDDFSVIKHVWPGAARGSILITSRDSHSGNMLSARSIYIKPFDHTLGAKALLQLTGLSEESSSNIEYARAISEVLGGLPLAIRQMGSFIYQRKLPLKDFMALYEKNSAKIDSKKTLLSDSEHTLSTVWELSLSRLSGDSRTLQNILAFFEPDAIDEEILHHESGSPLEEDLLFLQDELDLGDAEETLLQAALVEKDGDTGTLSVHRLIQSAVIRRLTPDERSVYFGIAVILLSWGFPEHWTQDQGHQFKTWQRCEKCLPHVHNLVQQAKKHKIQSKDAQTYAELLLRCSWYLYEREVYDIARNLTDAALDSFPDQDSLAYASATDLSGLIDLDMANPRKALAPFTEALRIREAKMGPDDAFIAFSLNNIALAYTEIPDLDEAYAAHSQAIVIRLRLKSDRIGNSYSNMSSLLLRMEKPDEAEEMLKRCPSLKDFNDDTFLKTGNPRFSGDMVLLSRIRRSQGRLEEALRLATKALEFRRSLLGNRFKSCDSLYDVASLLHQLGNDALAIELLNELITIASGLSQGEGQLARAYFKLCKIYGDLEKPKQSDEYKELALEARAQFRPEAKGAPFEEPAFAELCPWMLW